VGAISHEVLCQLAAKEPDVAWKLYSWIAAQAMVHSLGLDPTSADPPADRKNQVPQEVSEERLVTMHTLIHDGGCDKEGKACPGWESLLLSLDRIQVTDCMIGRARQDNQIKKAHLQHAKEDILWELQHSGAVLGLPAQMLQLSNAMPTHKVKEREEDTSRQGYLRVAMACALSCPDLSGAFEAELLEKEAEAMAMREYNRAERAAGVSPGLKGSGGSLCELVADAVLNSAGMEVHAMDRKLRDLQQRAKAEPVQVRHPPCPQGSHSPPPPSVASFVINHPPGRVIIFIFFFIHQVTSVSHFVCRLCDTECDTCVTLCVTIV
jgi:hypothetical protein